MTDNSDRLNELVEKLDALVKRHDSISMELSNLRREINLLKLEETQKQRVSQEPAQKPAEQEPPPAPAAIDELYRRKMERHVPDSPFTATPKPSGAPKIKTDLEKFIGENLINKIGIVITVIGLAIGVKYSIDNNLINPLTRIILGYLASIALLGTGIKLKKNYESYSAVLVSGAMASFYFITFAAYSFYELIPQMVAFAMMVLFTVFTVVAAIQYNRQVIALIGLVGAYAVPLLLSDGSGRVVILFSYMAIINTGIAVVAIKKYWKPLYFVSFGLSWFIFFSWFLIKYQDDRYFTVALLFSSIFFLIFYCILLAYKLVQKEKYNRGDIALLLLNSFIFYGIGYSIIESHTNGSQFLGLFTLANAFIHFIACSIIYREKLADRHLLYLVAGLVLVFITLAIPVQLDGHWVTILWAAEAALLFWIGRTKQVLVYEKLSYPLMLLAMGSMAIDWTDIDIYSKSFRPFVNSLFLTSILFSIAFGFINYILVKYPADKNGAGINTVYNMVDLLLPAAFIASIYFGFFTEIAGYFDNKYQLADSNGLYNASIENILRFKQLWLINYSMLFFSAMAFINIYRLKSRLVSTVSLLLTTITLIVFLTLGSDELNELRRYYLTNGGNPFLIGTRYICYLFAALLVFAIYSLLKTDLAGDFIKSKGKIFDLLLHVSLLVIASNELVTWMQLAGHAASDKLGLSILWGCYALILVVLGIIKKKKHLRIGAIILFGGTLIKLFFYDLQGLNTISKTIVFVSLGVLLLIISFLYNKYKKALFADEEN